MEDSSDDSDSYGEEDGDAPMQVDFVAKQTVKKIKKKNGSAAVQKMMKK